MSSRSSLFLSSRKSRQVVSQTDKCVKEKEYVSVQLAVHGVKDRPSRYRYGAAGLSCFLEVSGSARQPITEHSRGQGMARDPVGLSGKDG